MTRRFTQGVLGGLAAVVLAAGLAACGSSSSDDNGSTSTHTASQAGAGKPTITMGSKNFTEQYILAQLYKQALQAKGITVKYKENIGSTEIMTSALQSGKINFYPEYTGVIVQVVFHRAKSPTTAKATYDLAKKLEAAKGYTLLKATPFYDTDVVAVTNAYAKKYGLKSIADLKKAGAFKFGAFPECKTRSTCLVGYKKQYGLTNVSFVPSLWKFIWYRFNGASYAHSHFSSTP